MHIKQHQIALTELIQAWHAQDYAADAIFRHYYKSRRYIGARDRRILQGGYYFYLRHKSAVMAFMEHYGLDADNKAEPTLLAQVAFYLWDQHPHHEILLEQLQQRLTAQENPQKLMMPTEFIETLPIDIADSMPPFLREKLLALPDGQALIDSCKIQAPIMLRVSSEDKATDIVTQLTQQGIEASKAPYSPLAVRLDKRPSSDCVPIKQAGADYQDEGAQLVSWLTILLAQQYDNPHILDYCAGAGGKLLAMADFAKDANVTCQFSALNIDKAIRQKLAQRVMQYQKFFADDRLVVQKTYYQPSAIREKFEIILADAPCSLTGTLRRNPDRKWKLSADKLGILQATQMQILQQASRVTQKGGYLCYVTCSLLPEENQELIASFLKANKAFQAVDITQIIELPEILASVIAQQPQKEYIQLRPDYHGTDGFFMAWLKHIG